MYIKIKLQQKTASGVKITTTVPFPIDIEGLKAATLNTYMRLGTQYEPIRADNFISLNGQQFPSIGPDTKISVSLSEKENDDQGDKPVPYMGQLVCCTIKNVGQAYNNNSMQLLADQWKFIFKLDEHILCAPNGTLYVSPNDKKKCVLQTLPELTDAYLSYSMLFTFTFNERNYYFNLDPLVGVRSRGGT